MDKEEILSIIEELEKEISLLPAGSVSVKRREGKDYYYHRVSRGGKRTETYVPFEMLDELRDQIGRRKELEKRLKDLKQSLPDPPKARRSGSKTFRTFVRTGDQLINMASLAREYRHRECYKALKDYVFGDPRDKVFILYGLRRTGKTTMMRQIILEMTEEQRNRAAFLQIDRGNTLSEVFSDLRMLEDRGFRYVFLDEVTMLEDFIEGAAVFSDIFAASGMKIVLSGTDSLGFVFTSKNQLYDRCILLHTTFIPYREFEQVLGIRGIDEYIRYGGTMSVGGFHYNENSPFASKERADEYIDSAIAKNIQHSLKYYQDGGHFRLLYDLYAKGELTNAINRVVQDINHNFTKEVITKAFRSSDLSVTSRNLLRDRKAPLNLEENMDRGSVESTLKEMLEILEKDEQTVDIDDARAFQIREYLELLDLVAEIDLVHLPRVGEIERKTVLSQPGMRYALAEALVQALLLDEKFGGMDISDRSRVLERILDTVKGFIMEEIVLLETKTALPDRKVYKVEFAVGELDMVVHDPRTLSCRIYEIKHSLKAASDQYRHLVDERNCALVEHAFGRIEGKSVIYRGETNVYEGIQYLNVEAYLKQLEKGQS